MIDRNEAELSGHSCCNEQKHITTSLALQATSNSPETTIKAKVGLSEFCAKKNENSAGVTCKFCAAF